MLSNEYLVDGSSSQTWYLYAESISNFGIEVIQNYHKNRNDKLMVITYVAVSNMFDLD